MYLSLLLRQYDLTLSSNTYFYTIKLQTQHKVLLTFFLFCYNVQFNSNMEHAQLKLFVIFFGHILVKISTQVICQRIT